MLPLFYMLGNPKEVPCCLCSICLRIPKKVSCILMAILWRSYNVFLGTPETLWGPQAICPPQQEPPRNSVQEPGANVPRCLFVEQGFPVCPPRPQGGFRSQTRRSRTAAVPGKHSKRN